MPPSAQQPGSGTSPLGVLSVNTHDIGGGAAKVMRDLHDAYLARGIDSWMAVGHRSGSDGRTLLIDNEQARSMWTRALTRAAERFEDQDPAEGGLRKLASRSLRVASDPARYRDILAGVEDMGYPATARLLELVPRQMDVLHLHNLHGYYFDLRELPRLTKRVPAVLTMHDAWLLTGHCAHPFDCQRWREGCGDCPDLGIYVPITRDASATNAALKRDVIRRSNVRLAIPSRWLLRMAEEAGLASEHTEARLIPNGVDISVYTPGDATAARDDLGLPLDRTILLIAAQSLNDNPFKDYATLREALVHLKARDDRPPLVVALGSASADPNAGVEILPVPYVSEPEKVAQYYRAADVYMHAARAENLPLAIIEAMACGTPVVASAVGGVPEIVTDGETGLLVQPRDASALARAVQTLMDDAALRSRFAEAGMLAARAKFTLARQVDAYLGWFEEIRSAC